jgi:hypothetical protein
MVLWVGQFEEQEHVVGQIGGVEGADPTVWEKSKKSLLLETFLLWVSQRIVQGEEASSHQSRSLRRW